MLRIALAALAALPLLAPPAHADETGMVNLAAGNCGYHFRQMCSGYGQGMPVGLAQLTVEVNCAAVSPMVVDRTGVGCFLLGMTDGKEYLRTGPMFFPGNVAVVANVGTLPFQGYTLCVGAGYSTANGVSHDVQNFPCGT